MQKCLCILCVVLRCCLRENFVWENFCGKMERRHQFKRKSESASAMREKRRRERRGMCNIGNCLDKPRHPRSDAYSAAVVVVVVVSIAGRRSWTSMSNPLYITPNIVQSEYSNQNINSFIDSFIHS